MPILPVLPIRNEVVACPVWTRAGVRPLVVHPGWRVDLPTAVALVPAATTPHAHPSRCAAPATPPGPPAQTPPRTTAQGNVRPHHGHPVAAHRDRPRSTRNGLALTVTGAHSHTRTTLPHHQSAKHRQHGLRGCVTATIEITASQLDPAAVDDVPILHKKQNALLTGHQKHPRCASANPTDSRGGRARRDL